MAADMSDKDVLAQIKEMKQLFKFGGELIPFMEELYIFLKDVMPLIDEMTGSLKETTENVPKAKERIDNVTETTMLAAQQIMDTLDNINSNCSKLLEKDNDDEAKKLISEIQNGAMDITFSLQFQDITAQKLQHARNILDAIHDRFRELFVRIENMDLNEEMKKSFFGGKAKSNVSAISKAGEDQIRSEGISQDDIDKLFG